MAAEVNIMGLKSLVAMLFLAVLFGEGACWARSSDMKKPCVDCHTMHNSQNGQVPEVSAVSRRIGGSGTAQAALLNTSCYGCHSDAITRSRDDTPVVLHIINPPNYGLTGTAAGHNTLAGGDFSWVAGSGGAPLKGHNVDGFSTQDPNRRPPGWSEAGLFPLLTCAGTTGCHGYLDRAGDIPAMYQTHHSVEQSNPRARDGNSLSTSYRWLNGVAGYEDPDYELTVSSGTTDHNQYIGINRTLDVDSSAKTISHLCAQCHGNFHYGPLSSGVTADPATFASDPWIRHPVDYDMGGLGGEFLGYGTPAVGSYNVATPLGSKYTGSVLELAAKATVTLSTAAEDAIIVCVSCHRAHGSPYDYSLRWNYKDWPGGLDAYNGCGDCHTAKN